MYKVKAIFDGFNFKFNEPLPFNEECEVEISFKNIQKKSQKEILNFFNICDEEDVDFIEDIIAERENFSLNRRDV
jgi:hypothetical protein